VLKQIVAAVIFMCLVAIAASIGAVSFFAVGLSMRESVIIGIASLAILATLQLFLSLSRRVLDLEEETQTYQTQINALREEVTKLSSHVDAADEGLRNQVSERVSSVKLDITALTGIARKLAERTARLEANVETLSASDAESTEVQAATDAAPEDNAASTLAAGAEETPSRKERRLVSRADEYRAMRDTTNQQDREFMISLMKRAVDNNEMEIHLQPTMALPARRAHSYEALMRFREADGTLINASECLPFASRAGLLSALDLKMMGRVVTVASRLIERRSSTPIFANMSSDILTDGKLFPQFFNLLESHKEIASSIVLEFSQDQIAEFGPLETESINAITGLGFASCMDLTVNRAIDPRRLYSQGFRYIKMPVDVLTAEDEIEGLDIHPQDLTDFARRSGVTLIATNIEAEPQVIRALEYGVKHGQGHLFARAKPVRADMLAQAKPPAENNRQSRISTSALRNLQRSA
jgi:cyclic-di-GMP phosphodiesterase TipF (flagellum assembly factor)